MIQNCFDTSILQSISDLLVAMTPLWVYGEPDSFLCSPKSDDEHKQLSSEYHILKRPNHIGIVMSVLKFPIARCPMLPVLGLGDLLPEAGSPGGRPKNPIFQFL